MRQSGYNYYQRGKGGSQRGKEYENKESSNEEFSRDHRDDKRHQKSDRQRYEMSPGTTPDHQEFSGIYTQSDSKYRWRKVHGNLDLFVMERNERHLTSLWKLHKMPSRRSHPPPSDFKKQNQAFNASFPQPSPLFPETPESRALSRAASRQKMQEQLDSFFYDRWKKADEFQNIENSPKYKSHSHKAKPDHRYPMYDRWSRHDNAGFGASPGSRNDSPDEPPNKETSFSHHNPRPGYWQHSTPNGAHHQKQVPYPFPSMWGHGGNGGYQVYNVEPPGYFNYRFSPEYSVNSSPRMSNRHQQNKGTEGEKTFVSPPKNEGLYSTKQNNTFPTTAPWEQKEKKETPIFPTYQDKPVAKNSPIPEQRSPGNGKTRSSSLPKYKRSPSPIPVVHAEYIGVEKAHEQRSFSSNFSKTPIDYGSRLDQDRKSTNDSTRSRVYTPWSPPSSTALYQKPSRRASLVSATSIVPNTSHDSIDRLPPYFQENYEAKPYLSPYEQDIGQTYTPRSITSQMKHRKHKIEPIVSRESIRQRKQKTKRKRKSSRTSRGHQSRVNVEDIRAPLSSSSCTSPILFPNHMNNDKIGLNKKDTKKVTFDESPQFGKDVTPEVQTQATPAVQMNTIESGDQQLDQFGNSEPMEVHHESSPNGMNINVGDHGITTQNETQVLDSEPFLPDSPSAKADNLKIPPSKTAAPEKSKSFIWRLAKRVGSRIHITRNNKLAPAAISEKSKESESTCNSKEELRVQNVKIPTSVFVQNYDKSTENFSENTAIAKEENKTILTQVCPGTSSFIKLEKTPPGDSQENLLRVDNNRSISGSSDSPSKQHEVSFKLFKENKCQLDISHTDNQGERSDTITPAMRPMSNESSPQEPITGIPTSPISVKSTSLDSIKEPQLEIPKSSKLDEPVCKTPSPFVQLLHLQDTETEMVHIQPVSTSKTSVESCKKNEEDAKSSDTSSGHETPEEFLESDLEKNTNVAPTCISENISVASVKGDEKYDKMVQMEAKEAKNFYEEQVKLEECKNEKYETIAKLNEEQKDMEAEIITLKNQLAAETAKQNDTANANSELNKKIFDIESQIDMLNKKLTEAEESRRERMEAHSDISMSNCSMDEEAFQEADRILKEEAKEEFKIELNKQIETLKKELEEQMKSKVERESAHSDKVISSRINELEDQIEEINNKITDTNHVIQEVERKKQEIEENNWKMHKWLNHEHHGKMEPLSDEDRSTMIPQHRNSSKYSNRPVAVTVSSGDYGTHLKHVEDYPEHTTMDVDDDTVEESSANSSVVIHTTVETPDEAESEEGTQSRIFSAHELHDKSESRQFGSLHPDSTASLKSDKEKHANRSFVDDTVAKAADCSGRDKNSSQSQSNENLGEIENSQHSERIEDEEFRNLDNSNKAEIYEVVSVISQEIQFPTHLQECRHDASLKSVASELRESPNPRLECVESRSLKPGESNPIDTESDPLSLRTTQLPNRAYYSLTKTDATPKINPRTSGRNPHLYEPEETDDVQQCTTLDSSPKTEITPPRSRKFGRFRFDFRRSIKKEAISPEISELGVEESTLDQTDNDILVVKNNKLLKKFKNIFSTSFQEQKVSSADESQPVSEPYPILATPSISPDPDITQDKPTPPPKSVFHKIFKEDVLSPQPDEAKSSAKQTWKSFRSKITWSDKASTFADDSEVPTTSVHQSPGRRFKKDDLDLRKSAAISAISSYEPGYIETELAEHIGTVHHDRMEKQPSALSRVWSKFSQKTSKSEEVLDEVDLEETFNPIEGKLNDVNSFEDDSSESPKPAAEGWLARKNFKNPLEGLGSTWCKCPDFIWKHIGDDSDDELMTRRKCIALLLGVLLIVLFIAIVIGLIIGLATILNTGEQSPIRFEVIPNEDFNNEDDTTGT